MFNYIYLVKNNKNIGISTKNIHWFGIMRILEKIMFFSDIFKNNQILLTNSDNNSDQKAIYWVETTPLGWHNYDNSDARFCFKTIIRNDIWNKNEPWKCY